MKNLLLLFFCVFALSASGAGCKKNVAGTDDAKNVNTNPTPKGSQMKITIGDRSFTAMLYDNPAATAFKAMLPITINVTGVQTCALPI